MTKKICSLLVLFVCVVSVSGVANARERQVAPSYSYTALGYEDPAYVVRIDKRSARISMFDVHNRVVGSCAFGQTIAVEKLHLTRSGKKIPALRCLPIGNKNPVAQFYNDYGNITVALDKIYTTQKPDAVFFIRFFACHGKWSAKRDRRGRRNCVGGIHTSGDFVTFGE